MVQSQLEGQSQGVRECDRRPVPFARWLKILKLARKIPMGSTRSATTNQVVAQRNFGRVVWEFSPTRDGSFPRWKFRNYMHEKIDRWSYHRVTGLLSKNGITLALHDRDRPNNFRPNNNRPILKYRTAFSTAVQAAQRTALASSTKIQRGGRRCALGSMRYLVVSEALENVAKTSGGSVFNKE